MMRERMEQMGYDKWYYEDIRYEIAEGTPDDIVATRELSAIADRMDITEGTEEWDEMADIWWAEVSG